MAFKSLEAADLDVSFIPQTDSPTDSPPAHDGVPSIVVAHPDPRWDDPIFAGYLLKRGRVIKNWARRYFILTRAGELWYFKTHQSPTPCRPHPVLIRETKFYREDSALLRRNCLRISKLPNDFYVAAADPNERLEWMKYLTLAGGLHVCNLTPNLRLQKKKLRNIPEIGKLDLAQWTLPNVVEWLNFNSFGREGFFIYAGHFRRSNVTGQVLETIEESNLVDMGISNLPHRKKLMRAIREIRIRRIFDYPIHVVHGKIDSLTRRFGKSRNSNLRFIARSLSDAECLCETYLNPSILQDSLNRYFGDDSSRPIYDSDSDVNLVEDDVEEISTNYRDQSRSNFKLPVKILVSEFTLTNESAGTVRQLLSPVANRLPKLSTEIGILRSGLIVGPWYLAWEPSSLCIPRKCYSSFDQMMYDLDCMTLLRNTTIDEVAMKLASVVARWNSEMTYCDENFENDPTRGNCQDFVDDLFEVLEISLRKDGAFGRFLDGLKERGRMECIFRPSQQFKDQFRLQHDQYVFESHTELDDFVYECAEIDEIALTMDYKEEHKLLKSFDRMFWVRHFKKPDADRFKPTGQSCPFDSPARRRRGAACFAGWAQVEMSDGTLRCVQDIRAGDCVRTGERGGGGMAEIRCVIATICPSGEQELVSLAPGSKPWITKKHPIRHDGVWTFPIRLPGSELVPNAPCPIVYTFILHSGHTLLINGVECVGMAHGFTECPAIRHPYFGTEALVRDCEKMRGWENGWVVLTDGACIRDKVTGKVCRMVQE